MRESHACNSGADVDITKNGSATDAARTASNHNAVGTPGGGAAHRGNDSGSASSGSRRTTGCSHRCRDPSTRHVTCEYR